MPNQTINDDYQHKILKPEKQSVNEISEPMGDSGNSVKLCHVSVDGIKSTLTFSSISISKIRHLNHGDTLGKR